ncbi:MAG: superoxide dismutase [Sulfuricurvum sp.]|nr:superoxide dismutase [Sulfuricurvum sp.]
MQHELIQLPYAYDALEPYLSRETLSYHYGKHHAGYVTKLNALLVQSKFSDMSLIGIVMMSEGTIFNNAAQVFNHDMYWHSMSPKETDFSIELEVAISQSFGTIEEFKKMFNEKAISHFGSGWIWLSGDKNGKLLIETTVNADNPLRHGNTPLLTCDLWEHAYYIDYRNARADYMEKWWKLVNWEYVSNKFYDYNKK